MEELNVYTDGGCHGNPGPGGWAYRIVDEGGAVARVDSGYDPATTNNRMELTAVIQGLKYVAETRNTEEIRVVTDSEYVRRGITEWIHTWRQNGWKTAAKKKVKNVDLWQELDVYSQRVRPVWTWVKGHAGDVHNEACDQAVQTIIHRHNQA